MNTGKEAVTALAQDLDMLLGIPSVTKKASATLLTLLAERDALKTELAKLSQAVPSCP